MSGKSPDPPISAVDVCVVGSLNMDLVARMPTLPRPGETVTGTSFQTFLGGKGFNQAVAAARAGAVTALVGRVGGDDFGDQLLDALDAEAIDASFVVADARGQTGVASILVEETGENSIVVIPQANHQMTIDDVRVANALIAASRVILLQLELPEPVVVEAARLGRDADAIVILNPTPAPTSGSVAAFAGLVDYVVLNETEAAALSRDGDPGTSAARLAAQVGAKSIVTTLGPGGVTVWADGRLDHVGAHRVSAVDAVGAGDAFCGAMAASLAAGASLSDAVRFGNAAGGLAVTVHGAEPSLPRADAIRRLLAEAD